MIYSLHTKGEDFNADKILRWAEIPYQVIDLKAIDYHPNDTIVVSPKNFGSDWKESCKILINHLHDKFKKVVVIGHSEGALIGMISSRLIADSFISIAGAGEDYLTLIQRQLSNRAPFVKSMSDSIIEQLRNNKIVDTVSPLMNNLFNPANQRFLIDASRYKPVEEISKLDIPVLIVQGKI